MIDCSTTENYFKEKARMTRRKKDGSCGISCDNCPLSPMNNGFSMVCYLFVEAHPEEAIAIVQKWSDDHIVGSYKNDFLEKFPNANPGLFDKSSSRICRKLIYGYDKIVCEFKDCADCWNEPME